MCLNTRFQSFRYSNSKVKQNFILIFSYQYNALFWDKTVKQKAFYQNTDNILKVKMNWLLFWLFCSSKLGSWGILHLSDAPSDAHTCITLPVSTRDTSYKHILKVMDVPDITGVTFPDRGTAV